MLGGRGWRRHIRCVGYWLSPPPPPSDKTRDFDDSAQPRLACPLGRRGSQRVFVNRQWLEGRWARNDWGHDLHAVYRIRTVEMQRATTEQENMHSGAGVRKELGSGEWGSQPYLMACRVCRPFFHRQNPSCTVLVHGMMYICVNGVHG